MLDRATLCAMTDATTVAIRAWSPDDLPLLHGLLGDPAMTEHLGGPETEDQIMKRHGRYLAIVASGTAGVFAITVGPSATPVGWVGYWDSEWRGEATWETGWSVLPAWQGRGIASRGASLALERAADERTHRFVHAYPAVANIASNRVCEHLGFELVDTAEFEYPPGTGHRMSANNWRRPLF